ncbi:MAG: site-specific integrase [Treponema sp.]|jgi:site-specific recombinase XerD|nr:site-specific integrase [Treponema sp.]
MKIGDFANIFELNGYWRYKRAEKKKLFTDKSMLTRAATMKNWIVPLWGERNPRRLTVKMIDHAMMGATSELTRRPLAGATRNRILSVLSELYVHLIEEGHLRINPVHDVVRCNSYPEKPRSALPIAEIKTLFPDSHAELKRIWRTQKYICAFLILRDTGLRPGELVALKWGDWNPEIKFFPILRAIESGSRDREKGTKTGATKPAIITDQTAMEIETLQKKVKPKPEDYIFANKYGVPYSTHRLSWNFHQAVARAGLDRSELTPYWLRHTFNSMMLETNSTETVQLLMGHNTEAMTRYYRHATAESLARTADKIREKVNACRLF